MLEVGNIVTLDNNQEYLLLEEIKKDNTSYYYSTRVESDESLTGEYLFFEAMKDGEDEYLKIVNDQDLCDELLDEVKEAFIDQYEELQNKINQTETEAE